MKNYFKILTISIVIIMTSFIIYDSSRPDFGEIPNDFDLLIKEVTKNTELIDANTDHNQALDVSEYAVKNNIKIPEVLINFDSHSDVYLNVPSLKFKMARVENWINEYFAKNPNVKELYWVIPDEEIHNLSLQTLFAENDFKALKDSTPLYGNSLNTDIAWLHFVFTPLDKESFTQEFLIDPNTGIINELSRNPIINEQVFSKNINYRKVKITTCTEKNLPDFKGKNVFLSIDADYTSNSGFDTVDNFKITTNKTEIAKKFYSIFNTLKDKNITPQIISLSLSPQYLPRKHHSFVSDIFVRIIEASGKKDEIGTYIRKYEPTAKYVELDY